MNQTYLLPRWWWFFMVIYKQIPVYSWGGNKNLSTIHQSRWEFPRNFPTYLAILCVWPFWDGGWWKRDPEFPNVFCDQRSNELGDFERSLWFTWYFWIFFSAFPNKKKPWVNRSIHFVGLFTPKKNGPLHPALMGPWVIMNWAWMITLEKWSVRLDPCPM